MYGYKRPYSYGRSGYYSYGRGSKYMRRGTVGRAIAGSAAAKRSDKQETYSCTVNGVAQTKLRATNNLSDSFTFHPFQGGLTDKNIINDQANLVKGGCVNDRGFRMKCACYDEVKLDTMKVTLNPTQIGNMYPTVTICTMWDRKASPKEVGYIGSEAWMANGSQPTPTEIFNNEGTIKTILNANNTYGIRRYCRASSIIEKGGFFDSSILYNATENESPLRIMYLDAWLRGPLAFAPALNCCVYSALTGSQDQFINFSYKVEYTFTFRNPKSDMDWFLTVEAPGYVNPDMPETKIDPIQRTIHEIYVLKSNGATALPEAKRDLSQLFISQKMEDDDEEETKKEDFDDHDPGTS